MEAPFRFPITGLADIERLLVVLAASPRLVPGSLRLTEGRALLAEQLAAEGRPDGITRARSIRGFQKLLRALWQQPLQAQHPRFLRFDAKLAEDPSILFSMRMDVPAAGFFPRWVDLEGSREPLVLERLRDVYVEIGGEAQLTLVEV